MKAAQPDAVPIAGGTDLMVALNFDRARPRPSSTSRACAELRDWGADDGRLRVGAGVTYTRLIDELGDRLPGPGHRRRARSARRRSATAARWAATSAPPRRPATGCRRSTSPTPRSSWRSTTGTRRLPVAEFVTGPKRNGRARRRADRRLPPAGRRPGRSSSPRSARATRWSSRSARSRWRSGPSAARCARASARPGRRRSAPAEAEAFIAGVLDEEGLWEGRGAAPRRRRSSASASSSRPPRRADRRRPRQRRLPPPRARRARRGARSRGPGRSSGAPDAHRQRRAARGRRRLGGREPAHGAARPPRPAGLQERLRAGRVRLVLGLPRRRARVLVPRARRPGRGPRGRHRRGAGRGRASCTRSSRPSSRPAPCSAASARRG